MEQFIQTQKFQSHFNHLQNDLLDNIKYAVNIQSAILPSEKKLRAYCPESFIIYKPQRYVSGDFYWLQGNNQKLSLVLGDSTGHGVSASYISMIVLSALETLNNENQEIENPKKVLEYLNHHLYSFLKKEHGSRLFESAEMTSVTFDFAKKTLSYASAGISILAYRNGEITRLNKNKTSVGEFNRDTFHVDKYTHHLIPGERIFIMSDGIKDQHGGNRNKKLGSQKLQELLIETSMLSTSGQKNIIESFLSNWRNMNEQTDDISLIGVAVPKF